MVRILCFGDSNTWGFISGSNRQRYGENERWTKLLAKQLGAEFEVIEEGLNSRTLMTESYAVSSRDGRAKPGRNGYNYLLPCMDSHDKFDILVLMLGTNELKNEFNNSPADIVDMIEKFAEAVTSYCSQIDGSHPKLIISGIPLVSEEVSKIKENNKFYNTREKSETFVKLLSKYCESAKIEFVNNSDLACGVDGVHLTAESHRLLAERLAERIKELI